MSTSFEDRHHCGFVLRLVEEPSRLVVEPKAISLWAVAAWMVFVFVAGLVLLRSIGEEDPRPFTLWVTGVCFVTPFLLGFLHLLNRNQREMGPFLEVDRSRRVVVLPRDGKALGFDDIQAVSMIAGWYWSDRGDVGWERVGEMSLVIREEHGGSSRWLVLRHGYAKEVDDLAVRVAEWVDKPVERVTLKWKDRRKQAGCLEKLT